MKKYSIIFILFILLIGCLHEICSADPAPSKITGFYVSKSENDLGLTWDRATVDIYSSISAIEYYNIYRDTTPLFIPDQVNGTNLIIQIANNSFTDPGILLANDSYFYYITAVTTDGTESLIPSDIGYKIRISLTFESETSNKHWLSLPYGTNYTTASDLGADAPNISHVIRWNPSTQSEEVWNQVDSTGINFPIIPGEAYALIITADTVINLVGAHNDTTFNWAYNPDNFNINWLSLPFPNAYGKASKLAQDIPNLTKVGQYDSLNDTYQSWFNLDSMWMGTDFTLVPGNPVLTVVDANTTWAPSTGNPTVFVTADATDGLNWLTVNLSGIVEDKNGSITNYQWDYDGDGIFDYADAVSSDTTFTYTNAGVFNPTLLVTDNDGHRNYNYKIVEIFLLENEISLEDFNPSSEEFTEFSYTISNDGLMTIMIYDNSDNLIRTIISDQSVTSGQNTTTWDGKDNNNQIVSDGAYYAVFEYEIDGTPNTYTLDLRTTSGSVDISKDLVDVNVQEFLSPLEGQFVDIEYTLPNKAYVTIEIGNQSTGEVIRHLVTDKPQSSGIHVQVWDGVDDSGQLLTPGTLYFVKIEAIALADNAIITSGLGPAILNVAVNPARFNPSSNPYGVQNCGNAAISFKLNRAGDVTATVFNKNGTIVRSINALGLSSGENQILWNGRDDNDILLSDGEYIIQLKAKDTNGTDSEPFYVQAEIFY